jgi:hypothetical protein
LDCSGRSQTNLDAGAGVAIREGLLKGGEADFSRVTKRFRPVEAKSDEYTLTGDLD